MDEEHECEHCVCGHEDCQHENNMFGVEWCADKGCGCDGFRHPDQME